MEKCSYCGAPHDGVCPRVKTIHYAKDGGMARVEFFAPNECPSTVPYLIGYDERGERIMAVNVEGVK